MDETDVKGRSATRSATMYDVAERAGVSSQTVSRLLRGYEGIRPATQAKVERAMRELDYRPNSAARALKTGKTSRLAALTHEATQVGPAGIIRGATEAAREAGYVLDVVSLDAESSGAVETALRALQHQDLDGIIALASTDEMNRAFDASHLNATVVRAGEPDDGPGSPMSDLSTRSIPELVSHLVDLGHRHMVHVSGPTNWAAARNRIRAVREAIEAAGAPEPAVLSGDWSAESGYRAIMGNALAGATAIIAANDQMALGAIQALHQLGVSVPDEVSVTGIDDIPESGYFIPPLTTIRVDFEQQGRHAVQLALRHLGTEVDAVDRVLSSKVVIRSSTAPAPYRGS